MKIVVMTEDLVPALAELERQCFSRPWSAQALLEELKNPAACFKAAIEDGRAVGYAGMHVVCGECYIANVAVDPKFRRRGCATALLGALEDEARRREGEFLSLEVRPSNTEAVRLYAGLGFLETGRRRDFYSEPREDGLILTKYLKKGT